MSNLNPLAISALITALTCSWVATLLITFGKETIHKTWSLFNLSIAGWAFCVFGATMSQNQEYAYTLWKISQSFGIFISIFFFHSVCLFCELNHRLLIKLAYLYGILYNIPKFWGYPYTGVNYLFGSVYYLGTHKAIFLIFVAFWFFLVILGNYELYQYYKTKYDNKAKQANLIFTFFIFSFIGFISGSTIFLPMLGINFYPITISLISIYAIGFTYMIFKYQFLDIQIIIQKSLLYSILITFITSFYLILVFISEKYSQGILGYNSLVISTINVLIISMLFAPVKNKIQYFLDRYFFKGTHAQIAEQNELLRQEVAKTEKLKAVATLASGMAHEIKNPLTAIKTFSEFLPQKFEDKEFLKRFAPLLNHEVERINQLVHNLLDFARPAPLKLEDTDVHALLTSTLNFLDNQLVKNKINVAYEFHAPEAMILKVDPNQLKQACFNLFLNAIEAMTEGGTLTMRTQLTPKTFKIIIQDTGNGITPDDLPHIFDPFFTKKDSGTGLGLSVTHGIVAQHGGRIWVESEVGKGASFIVELPVRSEMDNKVS